ncbi:MAG: gliding motility-associated C-terminal domain-containing protein [Paludibacteraceae bacterium]|nr:gliding motility-associated C-terminal domain-containing protein [Paludibacteraceae bacterium]
MRSIILSLIFTLFPTLAQTAIVKLTAIDYEGNPCERAFVEIEGVVFDEDFNKTFVPIRTEELKKGFLKMELQGYEEFRIRALGEERFVVAGNEIYSMLIDEAWRSSNPIEVHDYEFYLYSEEKTGPFVLLLLHYNVVGGSTSSFISTYGNSTTLEEVSKHNWVLSCVHTNSNGYLKIRTSARGFILIQDEDDSEHTHYICPQAGITFQNTDSIGYTICEYEPPFVDNTIIPTLITPYSKDGINDDFMPGYDVEIFDIYGNQIIQSSDGWNGERNGELAKAGTYFYKIVLKDGREKKGTIEVIKK